VTESEAIVYVIDDDAQTRDALKNLMRSVGLHVEVFASAQDFLRSKRPDVPASQNRGSDHIHHWIR
jgi:FixJ family two-component response regulator